MKIMSTIIDLISLCFVFRFPRFTTFTSAIVVKQFQLSWYFSTFSFQAGGWSMTQKSPTNEDASDVIVIRFWDAGITYLLVSSRQLCPWWSLLKQVFVRFCLFRSSCCFPLKNGNVLLHCDTWGVLFYLSVCEVVYVEVEDGWGKNRAYVLAKWQHVSSTQTPFHCYSAHVCATQ